jgi:hypothetical protein
MLTMQDVMAQVLLKQMDKAARRQWLEEDWRRMIPELFPRIAKKGFADYQAEWWDWVWAIRPGVQPQPVVKVVFRGGAKSAGGEMGMASLGAKEIIHFGLYVSGTQDAANSHVREVAMLIEDPKFQELYPEMGRPRVGPYGNQKAWRMDMLQCDNGFTLKGVGLDSLMIRGIRVEGQRPDAIFFDDVDALGDTPEAVAQKLKTITSTILPARNLEFCVIAFLQNLIHRDSIATQVVRKQTPFLRHAKVIGPIKAVNDIQYVEVEPGIGKITGGTPSWPEGAPLTVCQNLMDDLTLDGFMVECQHDIDRLARGAIYPMWSEILHIVTYSDFMAYYGHEARDPRTGEFKLPDFFRLGVGHDWGATLAHPSTMSVWARPSEGQQPNFDYLQTSVFKIAELVAPLSRDEESLMTPKYFGEKMLEVLTPEWMLRCSYLTMSHEALSERNTYLQELARPLAFGVRPNMGRTGGIAQMATYLDVDKDKRHPFNRYPEGHPEAGEFMWGCPRAFWLIPDDEAKLYWNSVTKTLYRETAKTQRGMKRGREEMPKYHYNVTAMGVEQQRPYTLFNDVMDSDRYVSIGFFPDTFALQGLAKVQKTINEKHPHLRPEVIEQTRAVDPRQAALLLQTREYVLNEERAREAAAQTRDGQLQQQQAHGMVNGNFRLYRLRR